MWRFYKRAEMLSEKNPKYYFYEPLSLYEQPDEEKNKNQISDSEKIATIENEASLLNKQIQENKQASRIEKTFSEIGSKNIKID